MPEISSWYLRTRDFHEGARAFVKRMYRRACRRQARKAALLAAGWCAVGKAERKAWREAWIAEFILRKTGQDIWADQILEEGFD